MISVSTRQQKPGFSKNMSRQDCKKIDFVAEIYRFFNTIDLDPKFYEYGFRFEKKTDSFFGHY